MEYNLNVKKVIVVAILLIIGTGLLLLLNGSQNTWICQNGNWVKNGKPTTSMPTKSCVATNNSIFTANSNANIQLLSPKAGDTLSSQFAIKGQARVFENQLNFRIKNSTGQALIEGTMAAKSPAAGGTFGPFEATVSSLPKGKTTIEVFDHSAKDGSEIDKVSISVTVK